MADEFNPQGVDQTPQNNENPAPNGNETEPQTSAQNAAEGDVATNPSHEDGGPTQQMPSAQNDAPTATTEPIPNYAAAKGESTVVSSTPASTPAADTQSATPLYRPAPEFGAYGPTPTQPEQSASNTAQQGAQPTQQFPYGQAFSQQPQGQRNPYFTNNQQQGNSNPFNPQPQQPQNNGNPFATPNGQRQGGLFGFGSGTGAPNGQNPQGPQGPAQPNRPGLSKTANAIVVAVVAALVAAALCLGLGYAAITNGWVTVPTSSSLSNVTSNKSGSGSATAKTGEAPDWQTVASGVSGSVVSIQTAMANGTAKGSGAIIDTEGHIITNNHVISGAQQIQVTLANGNIYSAQLVGTDTTTDLAVIKLDNPPSGLKAVEFADSDKLAVGENVMAIGNPLGYDDTATTGIVSALNDTVEADGVTRGGATITKSSATGSAVVSGGPADKAGLKEGDTIVAFNGNAVNNNYSLLGFVRAAALGDKATLTIVRDGKTMDVDVTLDQEESAVNGSSSSNSNGNNQNNQNGNGRNGYGNGNGNNDGGTGDGGGFSDPFGLW